jgi:hypothetical protein
VPEDWPPCENDRDGGFGTDEETVGLNVTVRCGFGFAGVCCRLDCNDEIRGVVSVELDAIVTDPAISVVVTVIHFLLTALELRPVTMAIVETRQVHQLGGEIAC